MKKIYLIVFLFITVAATAQNRKHPWGVGVDLNIREYNGDLGDGFLKFNDFRGAWGVRVAHYVNPLIDAGFNFNYGRFNYETGDTVYRPIRSFMLNANLNVNIKFNNGFILPENSKIAPYLTAGIGMMGINNYNNDSFGRQVFANIPLGAGVRLNLSPNFSIYVQSTYNLAMNDKFDAFATGGNDAILNHSVGFMLNLGKNKTDGDGDGVPDNIDKCPETPYPTKVNSQGCKGESESPLQQAQTDVSAIAKNILFETDSDKLTEASKKELDRLAVIILTLNGVKTKISGHTDNTGEAAYNLDLSKRRAYAVKEYLVNKGIDENSISSEGFGDTRPLQGNDTEEGRTANRRVEITLTY